MQGIYVDIILLSLTVVYIVDVSGFTLSWREGLARLLHTDESHLRPLPPFDCGTCMVWWSAIIYAICVGRFTLDTILVSALCSLLAAPAGALMTIIREGLMTLFGKIQERL